MKRVAIASLSGLAVGAAIWAAVNSVPWWDPLRFWGFFFGVPAAVVTFGLVLMLFAGRDRRHRGVGRWVAAVVLFFFGVLVSFGPYGAFYHSPFSLEGSWLYPLGLSPLLAAAWLVWSPRRKRRPGLWDAPSAPPRGAG